jgi:peptidoglycan/xylan/chitin deacetylase (PgdA/CDA1 family)
MDLVDKLLGSRGCLLTFHRGAASAMWSKLPNRNFYLDLDFLDRFLTHLTRKGWAVVALEEALTQAARGTSTSRCVNFSIDDCYRDTFEQVVPLFHSHGLPVTLYVTTGIPDGTFSLWGAGLEDALKQMDHVNFEDDIVRVNTPHRKRAAFKTISTLWHGPNAATRYAAFCQLNGIDERALHWKHAISWDMLEVLAKNPLVEIGAHTITHARISCLSTADAFAELQGSRERLQQKLGVAVRHFAFPHGRTRDCGPRDFEIAWQAGFASAATTRKGLVRRGQDMYALPRITMNGAHQSIRMMEMHLNGFTGAVARMLGRV